MISAETRAYLELHVAVFLWGFTAILGDWIALSALVLVWWRVFLTPLSLLPFSRAATLLQDVGRAQLLRFLGIGAVTGLHWLTFYGAIKLANASIALICLATTSFFSSLLEPLLLRRRFRPLDTAVGLLILPGILLIVRGTAASLNLGILVGLASAFLAALFTVLNKKYIERTDPIRITFVEMIGALGLLSLLLPFFLARTPAAHFWPAPQDWLLLLILALACTTFTFVLSLRSLRHLSAFSANLTVNLEPVYGILLAYFLLNDGRELTPRFYLGVLIVLVAVFSHPVITRVLRRRNFSG
ncbi:MAG: DMT family transporter [Saprospiraceae bacterium]